MNKDKLDTILERHMAQPVGHGYIDIIVSRDKYESCIKDLIDNGFVIKSVSWWEWCPNGKVAQYGLGGPRSSFYEGWYSELPIDVDDIEIVDQRDVNASENINNLIGTKRIKFPDETIDFKQSSWLTPALWLDVPDNWRNKYSA
jgi:hypothetical protein